MLLLKRYILVIFLIYSVSAMGKNQLISFEITITGNCLKDKNIQLTNFFTILDSGRILNNTISLSGEIGRPQALQIKFDNDEFLLVFIDTSNITIDLNRIPRNIYDYTLTKGSLAASQFQHFMSEFNPIGRNVDRSMIESYSADSVNMLLSNIVANHLRESRSEYLNSIIIMTAQQLQGEESIRNYFEIIKDKYDNLESFVADYPVHAPLIKEIFISTSKKIDSTLTFTDLRNNKIQCFGNQDEYVLLDFWATWCRPCLESIPQLREIDSAFDKVKIISIALLSKTEIVKKLIESKKISWDVTSISSQDELSKLMSIFNINFYPTYILCTNKGSVLFRKMGSDGLSDIKKYLTEKKNQN